MRWTWDPDKDEDNKRKHGISFETAIKEQSNITDEQRAELEALAAMSDEMIDTSDIPEISDWSGAVRGLFFMSAEDQKEALVKLRSRQTVSDADELTAAASD